MNDNKHVMAKFVEELWNERNRATVFTGAANLRPWSRAKLFSLRPTG
jgi:hypothetical protein